MNDNLLSDYLCSWDIYSLWLYAKPSVLFATFGTPFFSLTVRRNLAKTVALKAPCRLWNVLLRFIIQIPYPDFWGQFRLNKTEKDCG